MNFDDLLKLVVAPTGPAVRIDSRLVKPGDCFVAIAGANCDGCDFVPQAIKSGAKFIVSKTGLAPGPVPGVNYINVENASSAAAILAQTHAGNPSSKLTNLAVTGTNGKTTVAFLVRSVFQNAGFKCGLIGTVIYDTGSKVIEAPLTTPDCLTIADAQKQMVASGAKYMVIEASSHALHQDRLAAIDFKAAAFTNLTGDHLDYHKTESAYLDAKTKLFEKLSPDAFAILNSSAPHSSQIAKRTKAKILYYGIDSDTDITAHIESMTIEGTRFNLSYAAQTRSVATPLVGLYNISNHLAAAGLCLAAGLDLQTVANGLSSLKNVPGRLEKVDADCDFTILIDYAHTDDALRNVLSTLKPLCKGRLIVLFGCGGDRDRTKRPRMAAVAEQLADLVIVTSDNPRTEPPEFIIGEIMTGFENPTAEKIYVELERSEAIRYAISIAQKNDILLIAGKGHENYQIIGKEKIPFSDKEIAADCLKEKV
ncbi:MAG: UDP-N-acetylmuramoyl-L-alanyl-D-glutamate--2,6-diaminopimelate ligase [Phycisphaerae bacterium]|jgi:UDP-N-acetylmuramoyl-L-alanyl-D-glutamate--2,6-diaminopimelate ligase